MVITAVLLLLPASCAGLVDTAATTRQAGDRAAASRSGDGDGDDARTRSGESDAGSESTDGETTDGERTSRTATLLPPSVSQVWEVGETGLFVTASDGRTEVVAFDLVTGTELYRVDTHPAGALRGLAPSLYVSEERGVFLTPTISERLGELFAVLVAYDLDSGDEVWDTAFPVGGTPLFDCGDEQVCARGDYEQSQFSVSSGKNVDTIESNAGTIIASQGEHLIVISRDADNPDDFLGLVGLGDHGRAEQWAMSSAELTESIGLPLDPGWGWNADADEGSGAVALTIAHADIELIGGTIGVDPATGRTLWARSGIGDCLYNHPEDRPMLKCVASADDPALVDRIVRMDPATGEEIWSIDVADPFVPYDVEIVHGTDYLYVWIGEQVLVYNLDDGRPVVTDGPFLCANSVWSYDVDYYPEEEPWEYFADTVVVLCDADGFLLTPLDVADTLADTDIAASTRVSFDWELRPFVLDAIPRAMIAGDSGEA